MIDTGTYLPLRVFTIDDLADQSLPEISMNRRECEGYKFDDVAILNYPTQYIPPFQIVGRELLERTKRIYLNDVCTNEKILITDAGFAGLGDFHIDIIPTDGLSVRYGTWDGGLTTVEYGYSTYYLTFERVSDILAYTDIFNVKDVTQMTELKWRNEHGLMDDIYWRSGFYAQCWVDSVIDKPTYPITEETREDQEGDVHKTFQRWEKRQLIRTNGVESVADSFSLLPVMDEVYVNDTRVYDVVVDISWEEEYDCIARIDISFMRKKILKTF